jgi:hypothetical protein
MAMAHPPFSGRVTVIRNPHAGNGKRPMNDSDNRIALRGTPPTVD